MNERVKVLYIVGMGRSGSTILANSLGEVDGFFSAGEICYMWRNNLVENRLCGCGAPFRECEVWGRVLERAFGGSENVDPREMMRELSAGARTRHLPLMLSGSGRRRLADRMRPLLNNTGALYKALAEETGSRVIVDSSKEPAYGRALGMAPGIDLRVLHLVRDPRATAYSWSKKKPQPDSPDREFMVQFSPFKNSWMWDSWNGAAEALWGRDKSRYLRLRYEDFVADPRSSFGRILDLLDEDAEPPLAGEGEVKLGVSHTVSGNPNRFQTGSVALKPDTEWMREMDHRDRGLVTALTYPMLRRYGYPVHPEEESAA
ncbi:sulfotransferase [soil metagenome]